MVTSLLLAMYYYHPLLSLLFSLFYVTCCLIYYNAGYVGVFYHVFYENFRLFELYVCLWQYNFEGRYNLVRFVKTVQDAGLYVILRVGPYVCAEWNFGYSPQISLSLFLSLSLSLSLHLSLYLLLLLFSIYSADIFTEYLSV